MQRRRAETVIERPADVVWARIRDFGDITWIPNTESCVLEGSDRRVSRAAWDFDLMQRLVDHDDEARTYSYTLAEPLDFSVFFGPDHMVTMIDGTIAVIPHGESVSMVTWDIETEDFMIDGVHKEYQEALESLKSQLEC
jgi:Polyketide cyclase / dehydrase and lipid transport